MKLGFIGTGKIAYSVVKGLCTSNIDDLNISLSPRNNEISRHLTKTFTNVNRLETNQYVLDVSDIIFISVRPVDSKKVLHNLKFKDTHNLISFVPFLKFSELAESAKPAKKISRAIPLPTVINHNCPIPIFNSNDTVIKILSHIGEPLLIDEENQFHTLWTLTGFIAPFYSMIRELSDWAISNGIKEAVANQYIVDMFYSLLFSNKKNRNVDFNELVKQAATPNGMNEQADREIKEKRSYEAYKIAAENLLRRFK